MSPGCPVILYMVRQYVTGLAGCSNEMTHVQ